MFSLKSTNACEAVDLTSDEDYFGIQPDEGTIHLIEEEETPRFNSETIKCKPFEIRVTKIDAKGKQPCKTAEKNKMPNLGVIENITPKNRRGDPSGYDVLPIQTFRPTWEQFKDFHAFIAAIEKAGAHKAGICKVVPPPEWVPRKNGYDEKDFNMMIPYPISQIINGKNGLYQQVNVLKGEMSVRALKKEANSKRHNTPPHENYEDLEKKYWKSITSVPPIYGADVSGSLTDKDCKVWNINKLNSLLDYVNEDYGIHIAGVNTAYLYFGMWKSTFAWHTEDMDLYSINYIHIGAPKTWYAIPPQHGRRFEELVSKYFGKNKKNCPAHLRHKMTLVNPSVLQKNKIPYDTITQEAGEIMITFPFGYHAGFNHGFNCAESTNFATERWINYGKHAIRCSCRYDAVKIDMTQFVRRFQPEQFDSWIEGKYVSPHPEEPFIVSTTPLELAEENLEDCQKILGNLKPELDGEEVAYEDDDDDADPDFDVSTAKRRSYKRKISSDDEDWSIKSERSKSGRRCKNNNKFESSASGSSGKSSDSSEIIKYTGNKSVKRMQARAGVRKVCKRLIDSDSDD